MTDAQQSMPTVDGSGRTDLGLLQPSLQLPGRKWSRIWWWPSLCAGLLLFVAALLLPIDTLLAEPDQIDEIPGDLMRCIQLAEIFGHGFGIVIVSSAIWLLAKPQRRFIPRLVACAVLPAMLANIVKLFVGRFRPIRYFDEASVPHFPTELDGTWLGWMPYDRLNMTYATQAFPSGHTTMAWGLAIGLSFFFPRGRWLFFGLAVLASMQRVIAHAHWPSDVLVGAAIGVWVGGNLTQNWGLGSLLNRLERKLDPVEAPVASPELSARAA